jgi:hypothetical protein
LQEVVTTRTTLLILTGWHLGIAVRFEPVWKGNKLNQTEPKLISLNRFSVRFDSKTKKKTVWLFILVHNRTEPKMLSPNHTRRRREVGRT